MTVIPTSRKTPSGDAAWKPCGIFRANNPSSFRIPRRMSVDSVWIPHGMSAECTANCSVYLKMQKRADSPWIPRGIRAERGGECKVLVSYGNRFL